MPVGFTVVIVYFLWFAGAGMRAGFSADDLMNLYFAVAKGGVWKHLANSVLFFVPAYRPLGAALYRAAYAIGGMNPLPLHIVCLGIALVNIWLSFKLAARLGIARDRVAFGGNRSVSRKLHSALLRRGELLRRCWCTFRFAAAGFSELRPNSGDRAAGCASGQRQGDRVFVSAHYRDLRGSVASRTAFPAIPRRAVERGYRSWLRGRESVGTGRPRLYGGYQPPYSIGAYLA